MHTVRYLCSQPDPVLVQLHESDLGEGSGPAVLMIPPFGWEEVASHGVRRDWADLLAGTGCPTLQMDLPGSGDSGGSPSGDHRLEAWTEAVIDASSWLRARYGDRRVVALGLGLGGMVAWKAAAEGGPIDDLALWNVSSQGRSVVRELRAFAALRGNELGVETPGDGFEVAGYHLSDETVGALSALDLTELTPTDPTPRRLLLLGRETLPVDPRLRGHADSVGMAVEVAPGPGWVAMTSVELEAAMPAQVAAKVGDWLSRAPATAVTEARKPPPEGDSLPIPGATERPWSQSQRKHGSGGILALPDQRRSHGLGVVVLDSGAARRAGPNRVWVEVARRWAPRGVPVLRLNLPEPAGLNGDIESARRHGPELAAEAVRAIGELTDAGVGDRWLVAGVCTSASWAFHTLRAEGHLATAAVLINPFALDWVDRPALERDLITTSQLRTADTWRRLLSGRVSRERVREVAVHALRTPLERGQRRAWREELVVRELRDLDDLRERGKRVTLLLGQDEPIFERLQREGILDQLDRWPNVVLRRLPTPDHTFRAPQLQAHVHAELDEAIENELLRAPGNGR